MTDDVDLVKLRELLATIEAMPVHHSLGIRNSIPESKLWAMALPLARTVLSQAEEIADLNEVLADKRRLVRELNKILDGTDSESLCDAVGVAQRMSGELQAATDRIAVLEGEESCHDEELHGWETDLDTERKARNVVEQNLARVVSDYEQLKRATEGDPDSAVALIGKLSARADAAEATIREQVGEIERLKACLEQITLADVPAMASRATAAESSLAKAREVLRKIGEIAANEAANPTGFEGEVSIEVIDRIANLAKETTNG